MKTTVVVHVDVAELGRAVPVPTDATRAFVVVRAEGRPIGTVWASAFDGVVDAGALDAAIVADDDLCDRLADLAVTRWLDRGAARPTTPVTWTAIVCSRSRPTLLRRALAALVANLDDRGEIVVVDNAPDDGATAAVARDFPVRYVVEPERGLNVARRCGVRHATGDVVLFTDDDAVVEPTWAAALCEPFADPLVGASTGITLPLALDAPAQELRERYFSFHRGFRRKSFDLTSIAPAAAGAVGAGVNMAFRREIAVRLGVFDPRLDCGTPSRSGGDTYALYRVLADGWRVVYTPDAVAAHEHGVEVEHLLRTAEGYSIGVFVVLLRALLHHGDVQAVRVGARWLKEHHVRELARSLLRRHHALPLDVVLAEWRGLARAVHAYRATRWA